MMKVLIVAPEFPPQIGGMETHAWKTADLLARRGYEVLVLTAQRPGELQPGSDFPVQKVLSRSFSRSSRRILSAVRHFAPDALLLLNAGFAPILHRLGESGPPVVARTVGNDAYAAWYGPRLPLRFLFWRLPHRRPDSIGARLRRADQVYRVRRIIAALSKCAAVLCNSSYSLERLRRVGVPASALRVIVGGVDTDYFTPGPLPRGGIPECPAILGTAGHLERIKGFDVALHMLALLKAEGIRVQLKIAGTGPEETHLRKLAGNLDLEECIDFVGPVPYARMPEFYRSLDLYLQPSVEVMHDASGAPQAESMGRGLCEAQSCGIPVVASRSGGIPDVIRDGISGLLVQPGEPRELAAAVGTLLRSLERRMEFAAAGRAFAVSRLSWKGVVDSTEAELEAAQAVRPQP